MIKLYFDHMFPHNSGVSSLDSWIKYLLFLAFKCFKHILSFRLRFNIEFNPFPRFFSFAENNGKTIRQFNYSFNKCVIKICNIIVNFVWKLASKWLLLLCSVCALYQSDGWWHDDGDDDNINEDNSNAGSGDGGGDGGCGSKIATDNRAWHWRTTTKKASVYIYIPFIIEDHVIRLSSCDPCAPLKAWQNT